MPSSLVFCIGSRGFEAENEWLNARATSSNTHVMSTLANKMSISANSSSFSSFLKFQICIMEYNPKITWCINFLSFLPSTDFCNCYLAVFHTMVCLILSRFPLVDIASPWIQESVRSIGMKKKWISDQARFYVKKNKTGHSSQGSGWNNSLNFSTFWKLLCSLDFNSTR